MSPGNQFRSVWLVHYTGGHDINANPLDFPIVSFIGDSMLQDSCKQRSLRLFIVTSLLRFPTYIFFMLSFCVCFKCCVCCIGCSCWFFICCCVECCTWYFCCCFSRRLGDTERVVGICLSKAVFDIESRIAVCVSTKGFIISSLERSSFWRKSGLSSKILQHLWGWFSIFYSEHHWVNWLAIQFYCLR